MYPRNGYLGQETEYFQPNVAKEEPSWWEKAWGPIESVLKTGTEIFKEVAPYTLEPKAQLYIPPSPALAPGTGQLLTSVQLQRLQQLKQLQRSQQPLTPLQQQQFQQLQRQQEASPYMILPSGQVVRRPAAGQATNWAMPLMIGFGVIILMGTMGKRRKR